MKNHTCVWRNIYNTSPNTRVIFHLYFSDRVISYTYQWSIQIISLFTSLPLRHPTNNDRRFSNQNPAFPSRLIMDFYYLELKCNQSVSKVIHCHQASWLEIQQKSKLNNTLRDLTRFNKPGDKSKSDQICNLLIHTVLLHIAKTRRQ